MTQQTARAEAHEYLMQCAGWGNAMLLPVKFATPEEVAAKRARDDLSNRMHDETREVIYRMDYEHRERMRSVTNYGNRRKLEARHHAKVEATKAAIRAKHMTMRDSA